MWYKLSKNLALNLTTVTSEHSKHPLRALLGYLCNYSCLTTLVRGREVKFKLILLLRKLELRLEHLPRYQI